MEEQSGASTQTIYIRLHNTDCLAGRDRGSGIVANVAVGTAGKGQWSERVGDRLSKKSLPSKLRGLVAGSGTFVVAADVSSRRLPVGADVGDGSSITEVLVKPMCKRHPSR